jgi:hypothetical protein
MCQTTIRTPAFARLSPHDFRARLAVGWISRLISPARRVTVRRRGHRKPLQQLRPTLPRPCRHRSRQAQRPHRWLPPSPRLKSRKAKVRASLLHAVCLRLKAAVWDAVSDSSEEEEAKSSAKQAPPASAAAASSSSSSSAAAASARPPHSSSRTAARADRRKHRSGAKTSSQKASGSSRFAPKFQYNTRDTRDSVCRAHSEQEVLFA